MYVVLCKSLRGRARELRWNHLAEEAQVCCAIYDINGRYVVKVCVVDLGLV